MVSIIRFSCKLKLKNYANRSQIKPALNNWSIIMKGEKKYRNFSKMWSSTNTSNHTSQIASYTCSKSFVPLEIARGPHACTKMATGYPDNSFARKTRTRSARVYHNHLNSLQHRARYKHIRDICCSSILFLVQFLFSFVFFLCYIR